MVYINFKKSDHHKWLTLYWVKSNILCVTDYIYFFRLEQGYIFSSAVRNPTLCFHLGLSVSRRLRPRPPGRAGQRAFTTQLRLTPSSSLDHYTHNLQCGRYLDRVRENCALNCLSILLDDILNTFCPFPYVLSSSLSGFLSIVRTLC